MSYHDIIASIVQNNLTKTDLSTYALMDRGYTRGVQSRFGTPELFIKWMEQTGKLGPGNVDLLVSFLKQIHQIVAANKLAATVQQQSSIVQNTQVITHPPPLNFYHNTARTPFARQNIGSILDNQSTEVKKFPMWTTVMTALYGKEEKWPTVSEALIKYPYLEPIVALALRHAKSEVSFDLPEITESNIVRAAEKVIDSIEINALFPNLDTRREEIISENTEFRDLLNRRLIELGEVALSDLSFLTIQTYLDIVKTNRNFRTFFISELAKIEYSTFNVVSIEHWNQYMRMRTVSAKPTDKPVGTWVEKFVESIRVSPEVQRAFRKYLVDGDYEPEDLENFTAENRSLISEAIKDATSSLDRDILRIISACQKYQS